MEGGAMGSHKVVGTSNSKIYAQNGINLGCFKLHISQNVAKSMASLTSQSCGDSIQTVFLSRQDGTIIDHPSILGCHRLKNEALVKAVEECCTFGYGMYINC